MKPLLEMTRPELVEYAKFMHAGLTDSEIRADFPTDDALRKFIEESQKLRGAIIDESAESSIGWDETDKTEADDSIKKRTAQKKAKLKKAIKASGGKVSVDDVKKALSALDDDDADDDGSASLN